MSVEKLAIRFFWFLAVVSLAAVFLVGCVHGTPTITPETEQEIAVVRETALAAVRHNVNVVGVVVDKLSTDADGRAGELKGHTALFLRSAINQYPVERMRELAVHEVCHAVQGYPYPHDTRHWCCMKLDGEVGYPPPVTVQGQWPVCS